MGASLLLLVTCIVAGLAAVWVMRAAFTARSSAPSVPRAEPVIPAFGVLPSPMVAAASLPIQRPRSATMTRIAIAAPSTEFPVEHTVCAESVFECVRTDVIAVPPPPPPPRVTLSAIIVVDPSIERERTLRAATAAVEALCDEGWESTREIKRPAPVVVAPLPIDAPVAEQTSVQRRATARGSARVPVHAGGPLRVIEKVRAPVPRKRNAKIMGTILPARSLMSRCFDAVSTVEAAAHALFDESTAVDEHTNNDAPPWLAPTSARFAR